MNNQWARILAVSLVLVSTLSVKPVAAQMMMGGGQQQYNPYQNIDSDILYNQDDVTKSSTYLTASETTKQNLLEVHFRTKKVNLLRSQVNSKVGWVVGGLAAQGGIFWMLRRFNMDLAQANWIANSALGMAVNGILFSSMSELTTAFSATQYDPLEGYEIQYVRNKPKFSRDMQRAIEENFTAARRSPTIDKHMTFAHFAVNLPTDVKHVKKFDKAAFAKKFSRQNNEKTFPGIEEWVKFYARRLSNPDLPRYVGYFHGPSRTGKTMASEWIADFLDVPFEKINLGGRTVQDLFGTSKNSANPDPGLLVKALVKARCKDKGKGQGKGARNVIISLEELDRLANRNAQDGGSNEWLIRFLTLFDPNTKSFYSDYFEAEIDISYVGVIASGNSDMDDLAFSKRLQKVPFNGYTKPYKKDVIWTEWLPNLIKKQDAPCKLEMSDFAEAEIQKMVDDDTDVGFSSLEWLIGQTFLKKDEAKCGSII